MSRWYESSPFIFPSQVKKVFYLNDTKWGEPWKVVQLVQQRGVFDVPELGENGEPISMDLPESNDAFQQENIIGVVPIDIESTIQCNRDDVENEPMLGVTSIDETMVENRQDEENNEHVISDADMDDADVDADMDYNM